MADHIIKLSQEEFRKIFSDEFVDLMNSYISFWKLPDYIYVMLDANMHFLSLYDMSNGDYSVEFTEFTFIGNVSNRPYNNYDKMKIFRNDNPFSGMEEFGGAIHFREPQKNIQQREEYMNYQDYYMLCEIMEMNKTTPPEYTVISDTDEESALLLNNKHKTRLVISYLGGDRVNRRGISFKFHDDGADPDNLYTLRDLKANKESTDYKAICDIFNVMYWHLKLRDFDPKYIEFVATKDSTDLVIPKDEHWYEDILEALDGSDYDNEQVLDKLKSKTPLYRGEYAELIGFMKDVLKVNFTPYYMKSISMEIKSRRADMYYNIIKRNFDFAIEHSITASIHTFRMGGSFIK